ncbi:MAG: hypothetical protein C0467_07070 [Planctomycetaceae bacterium]|nr:hypothetical protein [Planctomycetaceae bacterium]
MILLPIDPTAEAIAMESTSPQNDTSTPAGYPSRLADLQATLAEKQAQLDIVRASLEQFEADKLAAIRAANKAYSLAVSAANAQYAADTAPLISIESELAAEVEATEGAAIETELNEGRGYVV